MSQKAPNRLHIYNKFRNSVNRDIKSSKKEYYQSYIL